MLLASHSSFRSPIRRFLRQFLAQKMNQTIPKNDKLNPIRPDPTMRWPNPNPSLRRTLLDQPARRVVCGLRDQSWVRLYSNCHNTTTDGLLTLTCERRRRCCTSSRRWPCPAISCRSSSGIASASWRATRRRTAPPPCSSPRGSADTRWTNTATHQRRIQRGRPPSLSGKKI